MNSKHSEFSRIRGAKFWRGPLQLMASLFLVFVSTQSILAAVLQDVSYSVLPGNRIEVRLKMTESVEPSREFTTNNPARISLDFDDTSSALAKRNTRIDTGNVVGVTAVEAGSRVRVVVALLEMTSYTTSRSGDDFVITIGAGATNSIYDEPAATTAPMQSNSNMGSSKSISSLDFRRGTGGEGQIVLNMADSDISVDLRQEGRKVIADFMGANMQDSMLRKLDVIDFGTPATYIQTSRFSDKIRVTIDTVNEFEYLAYQTDNQFTIELKPLTKREAEKLRADKNVYVGERLSLMFQDIEVRAVLQIIAQHTGLNLVASDTVRGNLTLRLQNVPWDQALDI
ncbi:MAG: AMIN domain-containing protein, partial [Gammaproteobacteria bacterium]